jgi:hypothetical protein
VTVLTDTFTLVARCAVTAHCQTQSTIPCFTILRTPASSDRR